jgi:hypothetical protein
MVPLEVTHTALATPEVLGRMFSRGGASSISPFKVNARHNLQPSGQKLWPLQQCSLCGD